MGLAEEISRGRIKVIHEGEMGKRASWHEYGMLGALRASTRSSCLNVRAGTEVDIDNQPVGSGYNGAASLIGENCLTTGCRKSLKGLDYESSLGSGTCIGVHSEMNALGHLSKRGSKDLVIYNTIFPCHTCAKNILPYSPKLIVFRRCYSEKELSSTLDLLEEAKVEVAQLDLSPERFLDIYFNHPHVAFDVWSLEEKERMRNLSRLG